MGTCKIKETFDWRINMNDRVLKPCPFCGFAGHVYEDARFSNCQYDFPKWYIECLGCGIRTPTAKIDLIVKVWNRRAEEVGDKDETSRTKSNNTGC